MLCLAGEARWLSFCFALHPHPFGLVARDALLSTYTFLQLMEQELAHERKKPSQNSQSNSCRNAHSLNLASHHHFQQGRIESVFFSCTITPLDRPDHPAFYTQMT